MYTASKYGNTSEIYAHATYIFNKDSCNSNYGLASTLATASVTALFYLRKCIKFGDHSRVKFQDVIREIIHFYSNFFVC